MTNKPDEDRLAKMLYPLFIWHREPALVSTGLASLVLAILNYAEAVGTRIGDAEMALAVAIIMFAGTVVRSQVSPVQK